MKSRPVREVIRLACPPSAADPVGAAEKWLLSLWQTLPHSRYRLWRSSAALCLELMYEDETLALQVRGHDRVVEESARQVLAGHIPGLGVTAGGPDRFTSDDQIVSDVRIRRPGWVRMADGRPDPIVGLLRALAAGECFARLQWLLAPMPMRVEERFVPGFWVHGRLFVAGRGARLKVASVAAALGQLTAENAVLVGRERSADKADLEGAETLRWPRPLFPPGQPLDARQVADLFHPPSDASLVPGLQLAPALRTEAPRDRAGIIFGMGAGRSGQEQPVSIAPEDLTRHGLVIGPSGSGKTTWLAHLGRELARSGAGLTVIDPHGGLVENLAKTLPREAVPRASLVRVGDPEYALGLNPLDGADGDRSRTADEFIDMLQRAFGRSYWGPMLELTLRHAFIAASEMHGSIRDSARLLEDPAYRELVAENLRSAATVRFLEALDDASMFDRRVLPAVHRLQRLLATPVLASALGSPSRTLDLGSVLQNREVLLLDLSGVGIASARLLGGLLLLLLRNAAFQRGRDPASHVVIVDEASWFLSPTISEMLDGARKFGVGLVLAVQRLAQLEPESLRNAVLANTANTVALRILDHDDARLLAKHFSDPRIGPGELQRLGRYEAYARLTTSGETHPPAWMRAPGPDRANGSAAVSLDALLRHGRTRHMRPRQDLEEAVPASPNFDEPEIITVDDDPLPADAA